MTTEPTEEERILAAFRAKFGPYETYRNHQAWSTALAAFTSGWKAYKKLMRDSAGSDGGAVAPPANNRGSAPERLGEKDHEPSRSISK